ncbi:hypothetical protein Dimus_021141 [Dionaea muscipula]
MEVYTFPNGNTTANSTLTAAANAASAAPASNITQLSECFKLEHQLLRVPFEHYKKMIRNNHRLVKKEVSAVISGVSDVADSAGNMFSDEAVNHLTSLVSRLQGLKLKDLVDVFHEAKRVIAGFATLHNKEVAPALAWCSENKSKLKKYKSKFEFQLRLQEFIELVRAENNLWAITYARKYLAP